MDFAKTGDLKGTIADLKAINSELQKNKNLQKDFGTGFETATKSVSTNLDEIAAKTKKAHDALKVTGDAKEIARLTKEIATLRNEYDKLSKSTNDMLIKNQKLQQETSKATREQIKNETELIKQKKAKNQLAEQERRIAEKNAKEQAKLNSIYAQESARLNDLRKRYKDMALAEGTASKEARTLLKEITALDKKLKSVDASVGQFQRNVGNYGSALRGFGSQALGLAGIGGFTTIVAGAIKANAEFGQSMADLEAITGATKPQLDFFKEAAISQAKSMDGSTASASQYVEALKLIASAKPELLENQQALKEITDQALILSDASGLELPEAATRLTDAMNQFGAGADQASKFVNVLAGSAKFGSAEIPQVTEALLEFGPVAKSYNVSIQESAAAIEALAERGIKGSEAGTKLRNVLLALGAAKGLPKEAQESFERVGIDVNILADNSLSLEERLNELAKAQNDEVAMLKIFGKENISAAKTVLAQRDRITELTGKIDDYKDASKDAKMRTQTLSAEWTKLGNAWNATMIEMGGGGQELAETIAFVRRNLDTILTVALKLIRGFIVFKTTMMAAKLSADAYTGAMALMGKGIKNADGSMKGLNASMKANVIGLVAVAVIELADALDLFQSRADKIAETLNVRGKLVEAAELQESKVFDERIQKLMDAQAKELELTEEHQKKMVAQRQRGELTDAYQKEYDRIVEANDEALKRIEEREKQTAALVLQQKIASNKSVALVQQTTLDQIERNKQLNEAEQKLLNARSARLEELLNVIKDTNHAQTVDNKMTSDNAVKISSEEIEKRKKLEIDFRRWLEDLQAENIKNTRERMLAQEELSFERMKQDLQTRFSELGTLTQEQEKQKNAILEQLQIQHIERVMDINKQYDQEELDAAIEDLHFRYQLMEAEARRTITNEETLNEVLLNLQIQRVKSEIEILEGNAVAEEQIIEKRIELYELLNKQQKESQEKTNKIITDISKEVSKAGIDEYKKRKELREKEMEEIRSFTEEVISMSFERAEQIAQNDIDAAERQIDSQEENIERQRELAEQGLQNTLAFEKQVQAENEARLLEEQRRLEKIKKIEAYFNLLASYAKDDPNSAPAKALAQIAIADAIAARLEHGGIVAEEVAKQNGGVLKGKSHKQGGILIEAEGDEGILSKKEMRNLGTNNFRTLKTALSKPVEGNFMQNQNETMMTVLPQQRMMMDLTRIESGLREVKSAIDNKPVPSFIIDRNGNMITKTETVKYVKQTVQKRKRFGS